MFKNPGTERKWHLAENWGKLSTVVREEKQIGIIYHSNNVGLVFWVSMWRAWMPSLLSSQEKNWTNLPVATSEKQQVAIEVQGIILEQGEDSLIGQSQLGKALRPQILECLLLCHYIFAAVIFLWYLAGYKWIPVMCWVYLVKTSYIFTCGLSWRWTLHKLYCLIDKNNASVYSVWWTKIKRRKCYTSRAYEFRLRSYIDHSSS